MTSEQGRCNTCKYWGSSPDAFHPVFGDCVLAISYYGYPVHKETLAYATNNDDYEVYLQTKPEFGCVQYEKGDPDGDDTTTC